MKRSTFALPCLAALLLVACDDPASTTTISKSPVRGNTVVSTPASNGTYTRTVYGHDLFGNRTVRVTRGHENATAQEDLLVAGLGLVFGIVTELLNQRSR